MNRLRILVCTVAFICLTLTRAEAQGTYYYWFDSETSLSNVKAEKINGTNVLLDVDASTLAYGLHKINVMVDSDGEMSPVLCRLFYKPEPQANVANRKLIVSVDGSQLWNKEFDIENIVEIDVSKLPSGLHCLDCMLVASTGEVVTTGRKLFYKPDPKVEVKSRKLVVNVDGTKIWDKEFKAIDNMVEIDVSKLPTGLHILECVLVASSGEVVTTGRKLFYKPGPEISIDDWTMIFYVNGKPLYTGDIHEGEDVILLDASSLNSGISQIVCLLKSSRNGESYIAGKKDFYKPSEKPNSIFGYLSPSGSEYINGDVKSIVYTAEIENGDNPEIEPVNIVELQSVLSSDIYDISSFSIQELKICGKRLQLSGEKTFHKQVDLRPEVDALADIICEFDELTGAVKWRISSLDPSTSSTTESKEHAFLRANTDGHGMVEFIYNIGLRENLADGTIIDHTASVAFDGVEKTMQGWRNVTDLSLPTSRIESVKELAGGYEFEISGTDTGSGIWKYELYRQNDSDGSWTCVMEDIKDTHFVYETNPENVMPKFATLAIDNAGNVEISTVMSGIGNIFCDPDNNMGTEYYMPNGVKTPENYKGIRIGRNRKNISEKSNQ